MNKIIKLAENTITFNEKKNLSEWIVKNDHLTKGPLTIKLEKEFSKILKKKFSIFVNSGSSANLLIAKSIQEHHRKKNIRIIIPAVSWITTVMPFEQLGYEIRLVDCNTMDLGIDLIKLEEMCKKFKPEYVCIVHVLGHLNHMSELLKLSKKYKFKIIEDSCEAIGSKSNKLAGSFGFVSSFSFYYGHQISTIEGGMASTSDKKLNEIMLSVRSHGWSRDQNENQKRKLEKKYNIDKFRSLYSFYHSGFNLRSTEINAFLGLSQIKKIANIAHKRHKNFLDYRNNLKNYWTQKSKTKIVSSFGYGTLVSNRIEVSKIFKENNIECRPLICGNIARQPVWLDNFGKSKNLINADTVHDYGIYLPNHAGLNSKQINFICDTFKKIAKPKFFKTK
jgi:CDP-6-deoxy-D-xylo-4-hexulose-3-dehydrase